MKIVVFDLDETLGYFVEFGIFWDCLNLYISKNKKENTIHKDNYELPQTYFNDILNLYPEFLRPNIMNILEYLKKKKNSLCCHKLMIYTNNQGPPKWANHILSYFENKLDYKLFDNIIAAFKINGERFEICRTTNNKSYEDLIRCTLLPKNAEICYLDDVFYPEMVNDNVYYINIKPYVYDLGINELLTRFIESEVGKKIIKNTEINNFKVFMEKNIKLYNYQILPKSIEEYNIDTILSKRILFHIHDFFNKKKISKSAKKSFHKKIKTNNKTKKRRNIIQ